MAVPQHSNPLSRSAADVLIHQGSATREISRSRSRDRRDPISPMEVWCSEQEASPWRFVASNWFLYTTALVIVANTITMFLELTHPKTRPILYVLDQLMLCFYVFEVIAKMRFYSGRFLKGYLSHVLWDLLDLIVVIAGVLQQWILPLVLPEHSHHVKWAFARVVLRFVRLLRFLRMLRVLKLVKVIAEMDLRWADEPLFQSFIGVVITMNALCMGLETDVTWAGWSYMEHVFLFIYVFELSVRLKKFGASFFSSANPDISWNMLDFIIVVCSTIDTWILPLLRHTMILSTEKGGKKKDVGLFIILMRSLRLARILRLARLVKAVRPLFLLVTGVMAALQGVFWVLVLTITCLYGMGIMSTRLIGHGMIFESPELFQELEDQGFVVPFKTVPDSMFTLFRVMCGAQSMSESASIDELMMDVPSLKFAFVYFLVASSWTLLSILTAVVSDNMITTTSEEQEAMRMANAEEERDAHIAQLRELFQDIDCGGNGIVEPKELEVFLSDSNMKTLMVGIGGRCPLPMRDVKHLLQSLLLSGQDIALNDFVEQLVDIRTSATEKSIMRIEARLLALQRNTEVLFERFDEKLHSRRQREQRDSEQQAPVSERMMVMLDHLFAKEQRSADAINSLQATVHSLQANGTPRESAASCTLVDSSRAPPTNRAEPGVTKVIDHISAQEQRTGEAIFRLQESLQSELQTLRSETAEQNTRKDYTMNTLIQKLETSLAALHEKGCSTIRGVHAESSGKFGNL